MADFHCILCLDSPASAVESSCDCAVIVCQGDVARLGNRCPQCRKPCTFAPNRAVRRHIDSLPVSCPDGCPAVVSRGNLADHRALCVAAERACPLPDCGFGAAIAPLCAHIGEKHAEAALKVLLHYTNGASG
ncbi:hypothetical protein DFJ74DRAFT_711306 [Hyaloraphidium curvatum]|nr:hypothetical protein DFJ74DRAFT_711306 [Hyaloraphidium curvatum]